MIVTTTFRNKTYIVQASQVKSDNLKDLAEWCGGEYIESYEPDVFIRSGNYRVGQPCIELSTGMPLRKARAFVGDWITLVDESSHFKIYRDATFKEAFEEVLRDIPEQAMRRIVREELRSLLQSMSKTAHGLHAGLAGYETGELERAGHRAIEKVMDLEEAMLPHAWNCNLRDPNGYDDQGNELKCSCGVGDEE